MTCWVKFAAKLKYPTIRLSCCSGCLIFSWHDLGCLWPSTRICRCRTEQIPSILCFVHHPGYTETFREPHFVGGPNFSRFKIFIFHFLLRMNTIRIIFLTFELRSWDSVITEFWSLNGMVRWHDSCPFSHVTFAEIVGRLTLFRDNETFENCCGLEEIAKIASEREN